MPEELHTKQSVQYQSVISVGISSDLSLQNAIEQFEKHYIHEVLLLNQGHKEQTAQMLGVNRKTLYKKLKKYTLL